VDQNTIIEQIEKDIREYNFYLEEYEIPKKIKDLIEREIEVLTKKLAELKG